MSYCSVCPSPSSVSSTLVAVLPRGCAPPLFGTVLSSRWVLLHYSATAVRASVSCAVRAA